MSMAADVKPLPMGSFAALAADPSCLDGLTNGERLVVHEIQRRVGSDLSCFPSQGRIAQDSGLARPTVNRILKSLESKGYIRSRPGERRRSKTYELVPEKFGLVVSSQPQPVETAETAEAAETKAIPAPAPAQVSRRDPATQVMTRVLEALDALTRRVEAMERTLARMAERQGIPVEAPTPAAPATPVAPAAPVAPAPKSAKGKAERSEQLLLLPEGGNTTETEQKPAWDVEDGWKRFWDAWPDHRGKKPARVAFGKVMARQKDPEAHLQLMLSVIARKKTERTWREGIYMLPATFLNDDRWTDEPEKERAGLDDAEFLHATTEEEDDLIARMEGRA